MTINLPAVTPSASDMYDAAEYQGKIPAARSRVESMVSARHIPWHEIGNIVPNALKATNVDEVLDAAGMNWTVSKRPIMAAARRYGPEVEGHQEWMDFTLPTNEFFAITRDDTGKVLGVVKKAYQPFQNRQALSMVDEMLERGDVTIETAGVLYEGARVWILANIPREITIQGDVHVPYLCISASHDGSGSIRADLTVLRAECANSLRWVVGGQHLSDALIAEGIDPAGITSSWKHRHSTNVSTKAKEAAQVLGLAHHFLDAFEVEVEALMAKVLTDREFDRLVADILPVPSGSTDRQAGNVAEKRSLVRAFYESDSDGGKFRGTGWGAFQAFSSFDLWGSDLKGGEKTRSTRQIVRLLDGTIEKRSSLVRDRLLAV